MRICIVGSLVCAVIASGTLARADTLPIIVTYELKKQRQDANALARDPKAFWIRQILERIEDKKKQLAKPLQSPVSVQIDFVVARDGHIVSKSIGKSSGNPDADGLAIAMLEGAQPFPPMPAAMSDAQLSFRLPVRFR